MGFELHVLVLDSDDGSRASLVDGLVADGHRVDIAAAGADALARSTRERPDAILLEHTAHVLELACALRRVRPDVVIIVMTDRHLRLEAGLDHDVDYEVVRPFDVDLLSGLLHHLREERRSQLVRRSPSGNHRLATGR